jgi:hypothetical protein
MTEKEKTNFEKIVEIILKDDPHPVIALFDCTKSEVELKGTRSQRLNAEGNVLKTAIGETSKRVHISQYTIESNPVIKKGKLYILSGKSTQTAPDESEFTIYSFYEVSKKEADAEILRATKVAK